MIEITIDDVMLCKKRDNECHLHKIEIGDKYYNFSNPYDKEACLKLEEAFNKNGFKTRVAQNIESKVWSVAIIE